MYFKNNAYDKNDKELGRFTYYGEVYDGEYHDMNEEVDEEAPWYKETLKQNDITVRV